MRRGRNINWNQLGMIKESERVDTHLMLMIADAAQILRKERSWDDKQLAEVLAVPGSGKTTGADRLREILRVVTFWDDGLIQAAIEFNAPWHTLTEAAEHVKDPAEREELFRLVDDHLERKFAWPKVDTMRKWIGRAPTKKGPGDTEGQESLLAGWEV